jgi:hypothetical protein
LLRRPRDPCRDLLNKSLIGDVGGGAEAALGAPSQAPGRSAGPGDPFRGIPALAWITVW